MTKIKRNKDSRYDKKQKGIGQSTRQKIKAVYQQPSPATVLPGQR